jgi:hypothetical protein
MSTHSDSSTVPSPADQVVARQPKTADLNLAIGTRKGLFLATAATEGGTWSIGQPQFLMREVPSIAFTPKTWGAPQMLIGIRSEHWGPTVMSSADAGQTWHEPDHAAISFPAETGAALERVWQLQPDPEHAGVIWAGCEPTSLWRSTNAGERFDLVEGLWNHPHRPNWHPGFGGAAVHTIVLDPKDDEHVLVAMSTGGVYSTQDGGATWSPSNRGIAAYFHPDPEPEYGQCVHKVAVDAAGPTRLYAQNHHGVYRSDDSGLTWQSIAAGLPADFGFVMLADPRRSGRLWVIPIKADGERVPPEGRLRVWTSQDAGESWSSSESGLPDQAWTVVLRDAATVVDRGPDIDPLIAFGTRDGVVYASSDGGREFVEVARGLPDVLCVRGVGLK